MAYAYVSFGSYGSRTATDTFGSLRIVGALYNSRAQATGTGRDAPAFVSGNRRTDSESIGSTSALLSCPMICSWLV